MNCLDGQPYCSRQLANTLFTGGLHRLADFWMSSYITAGRVYEDRRRTGKVADTIIIYRHSLNTYVTKRERYALRNVQQLTTF